VGSAGRLLRAGDRDAPARRRAGACNAILRSSAALDQFFFLLVDVTRLERLPAETRKALADGARGERDRTLVVFGANFQQRAMFTLVQKAIAIVTRMPVLLHPCDVDRHLASVLGADARAAACTSRSASFRLRM
jgi:hypothetical protein